MHDQPKKDGLVPIFINAQTGKLRDPATISFGARGDSYYEYLLKEWIQTGKQDERWVEPAIVFCFMNLIQLLDNLICKSHQPYKL